MDALIARNTSLEEEAARLRQENEELRAKSRRLEIIGRELMDVDPCMALSKRIDDLEKNNTILSMENDLLRRDPRALAMELTAAWEKQIKLAREELAKTHRHTRLGLMGVIAICVTWSWFAELFW